MTPNNTNAKRPIENFASRAAGNGARIRSLGEIWFRNQLSIFYAGQQQCDFTSNCGVGTTAGAPICTRAGQAGISVLQKHDREPPIASTREETILQSSIPHDSALVCWHSLCGRPWHAFRMFLEVQPLG
jgi:hypothetical protein